MTSEHSKQQTGGDRASHGAGQQTANDDMTLGNMIKEAEEKGVKGALLSRLKKTKLGKVNVDPALGQLFWSPRGLSLSLIIRRGGRREWTSCAQVARDYRRGGYDQRLGRLAKAFDEYAV
jgi:hypothetical protein